jgi:hypothetical protein
MRYPFRSFVFRLPCELHSCDMQPVVFTRPFRVWSMMEWLESRTVSNHSIRLFHVPARYTSVCLCCRVRSV